MSTWLWVLIIVVVVVLVFGVMRRRAADGAASAARSRPALLLDQADGLAAWPVGPGPVGAADHPALLGPLGSGTQPGLGPVVLGHREQFVAGRPRRSASRSDVWCVVGLHPAVAPGTGAVLQGEVAGSLG